MAYVVALFVRGDEGSNPAGDICLDSGFSTSLSSSNRYLAVKRPPCECDIRLHCKGNLGDDATYAGSHEVVSFECSGC